VPGNVIKLRFTLNEKQVLLQCHPSTRLLDILRHDFGLKGTREGCGQGECGACLVLMNGLSVNSCLVPAFALADSEILTIEAILSLKSYADIRKSFADIQAYRCGFCSSGMQVALAALLSTNREPNAGQIRQALSGNLCACGSYNGVVEAVLQSSRKRRYGRRRSERS
jgi:aerobic-type carbon monoxide dehydrogenase small subunit (CoxS/CutS family)